MTAAGLPPGVLDELRRVAGDGAHCTADAASLPAGPGAYLLLMTIAQPLSLRIRTLTPVVLPPGWYVYAGNARGRGEIVQGSASMWTVSPRPPRRCWRSPSPAGVSECTLVQALLARPRFQADVPGFGGTDFRVCPAHLLTVRLSRP